MKKIFLLSIIMVLSWSVAAFSQPAIFNAGDGSLTLQCVRVKQNGQIGNTCYNVHLVLNGNSFVMDTISTPFTQAVEDTDQIFDVGTLTVEIPYVSVGSGTYSAILTLNATDNRFDVTSIGPSTIGIPNNTGPSTGSCNLSGLGALGTKVCIVYHNADASAAEAACTQMGGVWDSTGSCPGGSLAECSNQSGNGYSYDSYFYDAGIVAMYDQLKNIPGAPTVYDVLEGSCNNGGTFIH